MAEKSFYDSQASLEDGVGFEGLGRVLCGECALKERAEMLDDPEKYSNGG